MIKSSPSCQVHDDEPLWRFLSLPAFLALCEGNVSLPSVEKLAESDPEEGKSTVNVAPDGEPIVDLSGLEDWLEGRATGSEREEIAANGCANHYPKRTYVTIWKRELARRRSVWCWHRDPGNDQSRAMWHIYADRGVAIRSSVRRIKHSLQCTEPFDAVVRQIEYGNPITDWTQELDWCPFFIKDKGYRFEQEVRVAFAVEATSLVHHFAVAPKDLIQGVVISPRLFADERSAIRNLIAALSPEIPVESLGGFRGDIENITGATADIRRASSPFDFRSDTPSRFRTV